MLDRSFLATAIVFGVVNLIVVNDSSSKPFFISVNNDVAALSSLGEFI
jgi:hypothetical protein